MQLKSKIKLMHGWRTEWCSHMPVIDGDAQIDDATWTYRQFPTLEAARKHAEEIMRKHKGGAFGYVGIDEFEWRPMENYPHVCEFELIGETVVVDEVPA